MTGAGRTSFVRTAVVVLLAMAAGAGHVAAQDVKTVFDWAFVKRGPGGAPAALDFKERVAIATGDLFKIHVRPVQNAYVYLILQDSQGDLQLLFPGSFDQFAGASYMGTRTFIPDGDNWFTLDSTSGTERFHLVASAERLAKLESLVLSYGRAGANGKAAARQAVLDEITRERREHSNLRIAAEKPVTVAGGSRGIAAAVQKVATRIEAPGFYYKLFRLEH